MSTGMPFTSRTRVAFVILSMASALAAHRQASAEQTSDRDVIRLAREASNRAIAAHDLDGIVRPWMDTIHIVTSTSAQATGRTENRERMARQFASRPDTVYVRTPTTIDVFAAWDVASEHGEWTGRWTEADGPLEIGGSYQAQWRKVDGAWRIQAELFVPTHCRGGAYCRARPR